IASAVLGLASSAHAHYTFDQLVINDVLEGSANTYIRQHQNGYMPTKFINPPEGSITPLDADFTCNKGAVAASEVYTVQAGDKIGLKQAYGGTGMLHPGPSQVYISAADDASIPGTAVSIPGVYQSTDEAVNFSVWGTSTSYDLIPGPDVIPGGTTRGSADGSSGDVSVTVAGGSSSS
ncbi:hypothetical protein EDB81DRAFT_587898, partial [Dactylonectria macrodidyma]